MNGRFSLCMPFMLSMECPFPNNWSDPRNYSNNPHDPGGPTMCGITANEYNIFRERHGEPIRDVRLINIHEGWDCYLFSYWLPHSPDLPIGMDLSFFDTCVNCGPAGATKILQAALHVSIDGIWGPHTASAVTGITNVAGTIQAFCGARAAYYRRLANFKYFGQGWIHRALAIQNDSLNMLDSKLATRAIRPFVWTAKAYET
jgi:lysozyme family protein